MEILKLIKEWRKGCSMSGTNPMNCAACTESLINNIERVALEQISHKDEKEVVIPNV